MPRRGRSHHHQQGPDALLAGITPMLATLVEAPPEPESDFVFELKYDGFRALSAVAAGRVAMWTRNALDLSGRFPMVALALAKLDAADAVLDGEAVVVDAAGMPRFQLLGESHAEALYVFDLLRLDGEDLRDRPLEERRAKLEALLSNAPDPIRIAERVTRPAADALEDAREQGHEGLVAKRRGSLYEGGRSRDWLKVKVQHAQEMAIVGFTPHKNDPKQIGALFLGVAEHKGGTLQFAGKVGTGFSAKQRAELKSLLSKDRQSDMPVAGAPRFRDATWVAPRHVAQIRFTEWTTDGKLRHPAFLGLRDDKTPADCVREIPGESKEEKSEPSSLSKGKRR